MRETPFSKQPGGIWASAGSTEPELYLQPAFLYQDLWSGAAEGCVDPHDRALISACCRSPRIFSLLQAAAQETAQTVLEQPNTHGKEMVFKSDGVSVRGNCL